MGFYDHAIETVTKYVEPVKNAMCQSLMEDFNNLNEKDAANRNILASGQEKVSLLRPEKPQVDMDVSSVSFLGAAQTDSNDD